MFENRAVVSDRQSADIVALRVVDDQDHRARPAGPVERILDHAVRGRVEAEIEDRGRVEAGVGARADGIFRDLERIDALRGISPIGDEFAAQRVGMPCEGPFRRREQEVGLAREALVAFVDAGAGNVGRDAAAGGAVDRQIELPVGVPQQIVGVAHAGHVERRHRVRRERVVEGRQNRAVALDAGAHRRHSALVEMEISAVMGAAVDLDAAIGQDAVVAGPEASAQDPVIAEPAALAVGRQRFGAQVEAALGRLAPRIDPQDRRVEQTLGPLAPAPVRPAHRGVGALGQIEEVVRAALPGGGVGMEGDAVGHMVAAGARQPRQIGPGRRLESVAGSDGHDRDAAGEVRNVLVDAVERHGIVVGHPERQRIGGIERHADQASGAFSLLEIGGRDALLVKQVASLLVDPPPHDLAEDGHCIEMRPVGRHRYRRDPARRGDLLGGEALMVGFRRVRTGGAGRIRRVQQRQQGGETRAQRATGPSSSRHVAIVHSDSRLPGTRRISPRDFPWRKWGFAELSPRRVQQALTELVAIRRSACADI